MAQKHVWADQYEGPRFTYYSPLRPIAAHMLPFGVTVVISVGQDARTIITTEALPDHFVSQWSLVVK